MLTANFFEIERDGETVVLTPEENLSELSGQMEAHEKEVFDILEDPNVKNLVIDFAHTDYFASSTLAFFLKVYKLIRDRRGVFAFCHLSEHEQEILHITKLDSLWAAYETKEEALNAVENDYKLA